MSTKNESDELTSSGSDTGTDQEEFWLEIDPSLSFDERRNRASTTTYPPRSHQLISHCT